jgi:sarcosine oxidase subunit gamma
VIEQSSAACSLHETTERLRIGLKGPNAYTWLQQRGLAVPAAANTWVALAGNDDLIARLGASEFLIDIDPAHAQGARLAHELDVPQSGVYPVLREDRAFVLYGPAADAVLAQVCNVNFAAADPQARTVFMTLMVGVAVVVVPQGTGEQRRYRFWCDPTFGDYLAASLQDVIGAK